MIDVDQERGLLPELIGDGRPALSLTAVVLLLSGAFAIFLSIRREFLPHDVAYLGMTAEDVCRIANCRVVQFMFHDRVAFGGTLIAVAVLYLWLAAFPLRDGAVWAWWAFLASGVLGFGSFLTYLGFGYLDIWHGTATLVLLPTFVVGLVVSKRHATLGTTPWLWSTDGRAVPFRTRVGRLGLVATGAGITLAGLVILYIGVTDVFVTEDLGFMGVTRQTLDAVNPRLVPLIAHDRAGFGGGLTTVGALLLLCGSCARPSRSFHQAIVLAGAAGFGCAIGTHFVEGYMNPVHLGPAIAGAFIFMISIVSEMTSSRSYRLGRTA